MSSRIVAGIAVFLVGLVGAYPCEVAAADCDAPQGGELRTRLADALGEHFKLLLNDRGSTALKGKSADGMTALALYLTYQHGGDERLRRAAIGLAEKIVADMRATKHGVLFIKEKEKGEGESIPGGGPPALGWYAGFAGYVLHQAGGRDEELRYLAGVVDAFPWNERGWWASTMDVTTGIPKESIDKPSIINKTAAMAMAAGMLGRYVAKSDPELSARLLQKARACVFEQIIPAQEADGFWHYSLAGNDPKNKDILGYYMVTVHSLLQLRLFAPEFADPQATAKLDAALEKAYDFAARSMAPMTEPNSGPPVPENRRTPETPLRYTRGEDEKRGLALGLILLAGGRDDEAERIAKFWLEEFPIGDRGQDGAHAAHHAAVMLRVLRGAGRTD